MASMAAMADITVYNMPPSPPNYDRVGVFYIAFCVTWSTLLLAGMVFCWFNRRVPILRVRGLPLSFSALALLHIYWILGQLTYPIGATLPTVIAYDIQYFGMGVYFPLGIALFQASNLRFLHVAKLQKQFAHPELRHNRRCDGANTSWLCRLRNMDYMTRTLSFIGIGMVIQFIVTVAMWLMCAKYHPTYGIPGTEIQGATLPEQIVYLGRGWEWWPSMLWQVIWTWIAAPLLIWQAWGIRDTMGWRAQTIACCVCSLHATPMFLIASYVPAFAKVNVYFTPSQWIHVSIMLWEIFTVFVPIFQVLQLWVLSKKATDSMAKFRGTSMTQMRKETPPSPTSPTTLVEMPKSPGDWKTHSSSTLAEKGQSGESVEELMGDRLYTIDALEHVLAKNPEQLQEFAALSDFSGENIAFLSEVASWKTSWPVTPNQDGAHEAFNQALWIYATFVSTKDAEFPLNLSSQSLKQLQVVFEEPTRLIFGEKNVNSTSPFDADPFASAPEPAVQTTHPLPCAYLGEIPGGFNVKIFDEVQDHIKYLVLTNTWPKFVESMRRRSVDSARTDFTDNSQASVTSFMSWISNQRLKLQSFL